jgi:PAS domain S-box-containing protein
MSGLAIRRVIEMASSPTALQDERKTSGGTLETDSPDSQHHKDKINILLVDDRADKLLAVETVIAELGQNLVIARSGEEALRCMINQDFAVILMDVHMPGLDGFETAALIRQRKKFEHTPIIFLTATTTDDIQAHASRGYSLGAVDYLLAPVLPDVLRTKVSVFVDLFRKTEQVKRQAERLREIEAQKFKRQLSETNSRLEAETKRNRFFLLSIDLLAIAGFDGYFKQLNPSWEKALGHSESELKARPVLELLHPSDRETAASEIENLKTGSSTHYFETRYLCKDGTYRWLGWTAAPFPEEGLIYIFARDITERRLAEEQIHSLNEQLEKRVFELTESNRAMEAFTYSIAHDLRAPLRSMLGFSRALLDDYGAGLDASGQEFANRIVSSARRMDDLIRDLPGYSRLSREEIKQAAVNLNAALDEALKQCGPEVREKEAEIRVQTPLSDVWAQKDILVQMLGHLLSNSLKFVAPGVKPCVRIWTDEHDAWVRLSIQDNGIGIASEHHQQIFRVFERLHSTDQYPGTGIGLANVSKAAERMGGRVGVESQLHQGSRFWVELPKVASS